MNAEEIRVRANEIIEREKMISNRRLMELLMGDENPEGSLTNFEKTYILFDEEALDAYKKQVAKYEPNP